MLSPFWREYARMQNLVERGNAHDELLDSMLDNYTNDECLDLHNSRRKLKNRGRNLQRDERRHKELAKLNSDIIGPKHLESPEENAVRHELAMLVQDAAGQDWPLLRDTIDGDYQSLSAKMATSIGTLKSRVSRARAKLRKSLRDKL